MKAPAAFWWAPNEFRTNASIRFEESFRAAERVFSNILLDAQNVTLELTFNGAVAAKALEDALSVRTPEGSPLPLKIFGRGKSKTHRVQVERPAETELLVRLAYGLAPARGERRAVPFDGKCVELSP